MKRKRINRVDQNKSGIESPGWHADALRESEQMVKDGKASFLDWEKAKGSI